MKFRLLLAVVAAAFFMMVLAVAVGAQDTEAPAPYAGLKNPFSWSDTSAQEAGKVTYKRSCVGCHGANGSNIAGGDFSAADFPLSLEEKPDFYFWILSDGRLDKGMPPYKSSLSEEQRWQVLTYLRVFGETSPPGVTLSPAKPPATIEDSTLLLTVPEQSQAGQPLTMTALLQDRQSKSVTSATVRFFIRVDFFTNGLIEIGESVTDDRGVAVFKYTPHLTGDIQIVARYEGDHLSPVETATTLTLAKPDKPYYQSKAGIHLPPSGKDVFIGPESSLKLGKEGQAPTSAFRLPGGIASWLLFIVATVVLIWFTYFRVVYQVFRIPIVSEIRDTDTRLVPLVILAIVVALGIFLVLLLLTGPYSHFQLLH